MLTLRRSKDRTHELRQKRESWLTFDPNRKPDAAEGGFATIDLFQEGLVPPSEAIRVPIQQAEIITYVREGTLAYEDSMGRMGVIGAGGFQRMTVGADIRYSQLNASSTDWAHFFQIILRPAAASLVAGHEQRRFGVAERRGRLRVVASPDAREGSLQVHQDALVYSGILWSGRHIIHPLPAGHRAWVHVVEGAMSMGQEELVTGDGAGVFSESNVSFTAQAETEVLLVELPDHLPATRSSNGAPAR